MAIKAPHQKSARRTAGKRAMALQTGSADTLTLPDGPLAPVGDARQRQRVGLHNATGHFVEVPRAKRGRPPVSGGNTGQVTVRLTVPQIEAIDAAAARLQVTRSVALRWAMRGAIEKLTARKHALPPE